MDLLAAAFVLALGLIGATALLGFLALSGAWYLTHRTVSPTSSKWPKVNGLLASVVPPPVVPEVEEIVLHPAVTDYIMGESEGWMREDLKERAKKLYQEHPAWEWVLTELRKLNEAGTLPDV